MLEHELLCLMTATLFATEKARQYEQHGHQMSGDQWSAWTPLGVDVALAEAQMIYVRVRLMGQETSGSADQQE